MHIAYRQLIVATNIKIMLSPNASKSFKRAILHQFPSFLSKKQLFIVIIYRFAYS
jgi:hypothetical protein